MQALALAPTSHTTTRTLNPPLRVCLNAFQNRVTYSPGCELVLAAIAKRISAIRAILGLDVSSGAHTWT